MNDSLEKNSKQLSRRDFMGAAASAAGIAAASGAGFTALAAPPPPLKVSTPVISCGTSGTDYIDIHVCAGVTGAPAGFSLQWMTAADYALYGWPTNSDCPLDSSGNPTCPASFCKASFSGNASLSRYNLTALQCVTPDVRIGEILLDNGASTNCPNRLVCGTEYVFRAFAHAIPGRQRSDFTLNLTCSTQPCNPGCDPCVKSFGFWKTHYPDAWPADVLANGMTVGCQSYSAAQLESILLNNPGQGGALIALAHQVINTKLNLLCDGVSEAYISTVTADLAAAEAVMCTTGAVPPVGTGSLTNAQAAGLTLLLDTERALFECP